ncbi:DUF4760 domain-containing protein [Pseudomonas putida]|uniref:DUF4760 domain-containing protein n=1 Tax=Pseudomonas TaxID=286 RepID=UPI001F29752D|nr:MULTISPECIES: DUF4760 domain-containing protein [Pseudomonas]MDQ2487679.1 DUF4760 domain-containing protein [Pseudomonas putida]
MKKISTWIGAAAAAAILLWLTRIAYELSEATPPFKLDYIDIGAVFATALLFVLLAYEYILKRYPDTKEMLPLFSGVVWTVLVSSYAVLRYEPEYQSSLSILVTGVFVGMGWWIQAITTAANSRRSHTLNIIMASRTSTEYQQQTRASSKVYWTSVIPPELAEWKFQPTKDEYRNASIPTDVAEAISGTIYILNYFEFLAQGIRYRDLDACLLRECFAGILAGVERRAFHLIIEAQKGDPRVFEGLIKLTKEWNGESVVERYRSNPDNAAIGPRYPDADKLRTMLEGASHDDSSQHSTPSLATTDGVPVPQNT